MTERNEQTADVEAETQKKSGWKQWTPAQAGRALSAWRRSGLPLATFARQRGISAKRLRWWKNRLAGAVSEAAAKPPRRKPRLVPAVVTAPLLQLGSAAVAIRVPGGPVLEIADVRAVPPEWVGILMAAVSKASR